MPTISSHNSMSTASAQGIELRNLATHAAPPAGRGNSAEIERGDIPTPVSKPPRSIRSAAADAWVAAIDVSPATKRYVKYGLGLVATALVVGGATYKITHDIDQKQLKATEKDLDARLSSALAALPATGPIPSESPTATRTLTETLTNSNCVQMTLGSTSLPELTTVLFEGGLNFGGGMLPVTITRSAQVAPLFASQCAPETSTVTRTFVEPFGNGLGSIATGLAGIAPRATKSAAP